MRTLLRHTRTGLYFQGPEKWTEQRSRAYDFRFIDRARDYVQTWELKEIELAFAFDDAEVVRAVPLERTELRYAAP